MSRRSGGALILLGKIKLVRFAVTAQVPLFLSFEEASIRLGRRLSREQM
jgi:hypothetical protein